MIKESLNLAKENALTKVKARLRNRAFRVRESLGLRVSRKATVFQMKNFRTKIFRARRFFVRKIFLFRALRHGDVMGQCAALP